MNTIEIPDLKKEFLVPEHLGEFTNKQFVFFVDKLLEMHSGAIAEADLFSEMVLHFLWVSKKKKYRSLTDEKKLLISENIARISELLNYLFNKTDGGSITINYTTARNFVPQLHISFRKKLYGPADALTDISFLEYKDANIFYRQYIESKDEDDLNRMIAVLYRPKNIFGKKQKYDPSQIEHNVQLVKSVELKYRFAIFLFMIACEEFLHKDEITIDGQKIELKILYEKTLKEKQNEVKPKYEANTGLAGVAFSLASTGIFGPIEKVYSQNLYDVLLLLYKQRIEYLNDLEKL